MEFLLLRVFGIKPEPKEVRVVWKKGYTIIPVEYTGDDFNEWINGIWSNLKQQ